MAIDKRVRGSIEKVRGVYQGIIKDLRETKEQAYWERNQLVAFLSRLYPSYWCLHPEDDEKWEKDWRHIIVVDSPAGQLCWHIHDRDMVHFSHLKERENKWDRHSIEEKYERLSELPIGTKTNTTMNI